MGGTKEEEDNTVRDVYEKAYGIVCSREEKEKASRVACHKAQLACRDEVIAQVRNSILQEHLDFWRSAGDGWVKETRSPDPVDGKEALVGLTLDLRHPFWLSKYGAGHISFFCPYGNEKNVQLWTKWDASDAAAVNSGSVKRVLNDLAEKFGNCRALYDLLVKSGTAPKPGLIKTYVK